MATILSFQLTINGKTSNEKTLSSFADKSKARDLEAVALLNVSTQGFQDSKERVAKIFESIKGITGDSIITWTVKDGEKISAKYHYTLADLQNACKVSFAWDVKPERGRKEGSTDNKPESDDLDDLFGEEPANEAPKTEEKK